MNRTENKNTIILCVIFQLVCQEASRNSIYKILFPLKGGSIFLGFSSAGMVSLLVKDEEIKGST